VKSHRVRFWEIRRNQSSRRPSYEVRWTVDGRAKSRSYPKKALAEAFRAELIGAANKGEAFDVDTGLPDSILRDRSSATWLRFVQAYVDMKWPRVAGKSRDSLTDALASVTPALVVARNGVPAAALLRSTLRRWLLHPTGRGDDMPDEVEAAVRWLERNALPVRRLSDPTVVRAALDALALRMDGRVAAAETVRRRRAVFYNALQYAVEIGELDTNPIDRIDWRRPKSSNVVDRRVVANPAQVRELLSAVTYVGSYGRGRGRRLCGFFACMYFGWLRPAEAVALREQDCDLPRHGWGRLLVARSLPSTGKRWTDGGEAHDARGLKARAAHEARAVPIPPELVTILCQHLDEFGAAEDGRIFRSERGGVVPSSTYYRVWSEARALALTPAQVASPLVARPYDLRHAGVSLALNAGVPATEVAERAGHSVDVLLRVYAKCIDGQAEIINRRIEDALR
jgi:integrase